jgi:YggT family protein
MGPLINATIFLLNFFISAYLYVLLLRMLMQKYRVSWHNPLSQFVIKISDPVVKPLRRWIPGLAGFDLSIVLVVFVIQCVGLWVLESLLGGHSMAIVGLLIVSLGLCLAQLLNLYFFMVIVVAIMSWVATGRPNPLAAVFVSITEPLMSRIRRILPAMGGFDFSPVVVLLLIQMIKILFLGPLQGLGISLL